MVAHLKMWSTKSSRGSCEAPGRSAGEEGGAEGRARSVSASAPPPRWGGPGYSAPCSNASVHAVKKRPQKSPQQPAAPLRRCYALRRAHALMRHLQRVLGVQLWQRLAAARAAGWRAQTPPPPAPLPDPITDWPPASAPLTFSGMGALLMSLSSPATAMHAARRHPRRPDEARAAARGAAVAAAAGRAGATAASIGTVGQA